MTTLPTGLTRLDRLCGFLTLDPDNAALALDTAHEALRDGRCELALQLLDRASAAMAGRPEGASVAAAVCALRVRALHGLGRLEAAVSVVATFRTHVNPFDARVESSLLAVLVDLARLDEAVSVAQRLLAASEGAGPMPYEVHEPLALSALRDTRPDEAMRWTRRALAMRQDDGRIWLAHGLAMLTAGPVGASIEALDRAVTLMPGHPGSGLALGWVHLLDGDRPRARAAFDAVVDVSPSFAEGHGSLAVVDALQGLADRARHRVRVAQRLDAASPTARCAQALLEGGMPQDLAALAARVAAAARGSIVAGVPPLPMP